MSRQTPSLSFEVFPPNPEVGNDKIISALQDMKELAPHFIHSACFSTLTK